MKSVVNFVTKSLDLQHPEIPQNKEEQKKFFTQNLLIYGFLGVLFIIAFIAFLTTGIIYLVQPTSIFSNLDQYLFSLI
jgi:hypothetical protein